MKKLFLLSIFSLGSQLLGEGESEKTENAQQSNVNEQIAKGVADGLERSAPAIAKAFAQQTSGQRRVLDINLPSFSEKEIENASQVLINNIMKGFGKSLKKGGEFDNITKEFGGAGKRFINEAVTDLGDGMKNASKIVRKDMATATSELGEGVKDASKIVRKDMVEATSEVSKGMKEASDVWGKEVQEIFKEGSEVDKGFSEFRKTISRNANGAIRSIGGTGALVFLGTVGGFFILKYGIPLGFEMIKRALVRPKLIIESSKKSLIQKFTSLFSGAYKPLEMIFSAALQKQLDELIEVTKAINTAIKAGKANVKYRNLMLYGPPGTGKTMFAKELARRSGLEYAFMSGSSFSKFKDGEGIEALDELFAWAKRSKGLMIFIDEAENFLSKRENMDPQSKAYQLLNNFLNYTGERSDRFMIVFATNHQEALDSAMYRRIDDLIEMPLPSKAQRIGALNLYKNKILMDVKQNGQEFVNSVNSCFDDAMIESIAQRIKGLSYGDIEGIINTLRTDSIIQDPAIVTVNLIDTVVERAIKKHQVFTGGHLLGTVED